MGGYKRVFAIAFIWGIAAAGWIVLGGVTAMRKETQAVKLREGVQNLWGSPQVQTAPALTFDWETRSNVSRTELRNGVSTEVSELVTEKHQKSFLADSSRVDADLRSDLRRKGLVWYSLYDVNFAASYGYEHREPNAGTMTVRFAFPDKSAIYDDFRFTVNGKDYAGTIEPSDGSATATFAVQPGDKLRIQLGYKSRGLDAWRYRPTPTVARLRDFELNLRTHFRDIDFPEQTLSPSSRESTDDGWALRWRFTQIVSGFDVGVATPQRLQPGELASALAFSAPISLLFYFLVLYVLATLRRIDIHPINYFFLAGAFFAFHLLFAYGVDHVGVETAFALCSAVSIGLCTSYLRLVVSPGFALREAALAQIVYLIGFSLAHFFEGFTGLTVTVLAIVTLFVLMQLTGRVRWSDALAAGPLTKPA